MKLNPFSTFLMVLALALCGLCAFLWLRETDSRREMSAVLKEKSALIDEIQRYTNSLQRMEARIVELATAAGDLEATVRTNRLNLARVVQEKNDLLATEEFLNAQLAAYTNAFNDATNRLAQAYSDIQEQNEKLKAVVADRDAYVEKLNESTRARNEITKRYNDLVGQFQALQGSVNR